MRHDIFKPCLIAAAVALTLPQIADAAGLGRLTLHSTLGQPLNAEIELLSVQKNELSTLAARVASPDAYQRANLPYNPALTGARMTIEKRADGQLYLKAITPRAVTEPFVELLVELSWEGARIVRQYTALLDPPGFGQAADALGTSVLSTAAQRQAAAPAPDAMPATPAEAQPAAPLAEAPAADKQWVRQYGPVKRGETLNSIARVVRYDDATVEQTMVGLHRHNSEAFIRNNMNLLRTGRILQVPEPFIMSSIPQRLAVREIRLQAADWDSFRTRLAERAAPVRESETPASGRIDARSAARSPDDGARDVVRLSRGEIVQSAAKGATVSNPAERVRSLEEDAIASKGALVEANDRIAQLESTIRDMHRLMEAKGAVAAAAGSTTQNGQGSTPAASDAQQTGARIEVVAGALAPRAVVQSPPMPEPNLIETVLDEPLYLAAGGGVLMLGGLGFLVVRRRRAQAAEAEAMEFDELEPTLESSTSAEPASTLQAATSATAAQVRPLGRGSRTDEAAMAPAPQAGQSGGPAAVTGADAAAAAGATPLYEALARMRASTAPSGPALQESPAAVEPPASAAPAWEPVAAAPEAPATASDPLLSFDLEPAAPAAPRAIPGAEVQPMEMAGVQVEASHSPVPEATLPSFSLEEWSSAPVASVEPPRQASDLKPLDFGVLDLTPPVSGSDSAASSFELPNPALSAPAQEFELALKDLELDFAGQAAPAGPSRDPHWHDVQQKFDLAKAYEEMGDKDGARDILQEVLKEGDTEQRAHATALMAALA